MKPSITSSKGDATVVNANKNINANTKSKNGALLIVILEGAERFAYMGLLSTTYTLLTKQFGYSPSLAMLCVHIFVAVYFTLMLLLPAIESRFGQRNVFLLGYLLYIPGFMFVMASSIWHTFFFFGLAFICAGGALFKPMATVTLGTQFKENESSAYQTWVNLFYLSTNVGAFFACVIMPKMITLVNFGIAMLIPTVLVAISNFVAVRYSKILEFSAKEINVESYVKVFISAVKKTMKARYEVILLVISAGMIMYQQDSLWISQGVKMNTDISLPFGINFIIEPAQIISMNPLIVVFLIVAGLIFGSGKQMDCEKKVKIGAKLQIATLLYFLSLQFAVHVMPLGSVTILAQIPMYILATSAEVFIVPSAIFIMYKTDHNKTINTSILMLSFGVANIINALMSGLIGSQLGILIIAAITAAFSLPQLLQRRYSR